jgi:hypothetical protein
MVRFGGIVSDDEDGEVERRAIDSRGGRKFSQVELYFFVECHTHTQLAEGED